ncbi:MAG: NAD(P)/FAD-dependent oxidoreductase [Velocimicrobium sp.]
MIRVSNIKILVEKLKNHSQEEQIKQIKHQLMTKYHMREAEIVRIQIIKRSLDARKKQMICYIYCVDLTLKEEKKYLLKPNIIAAPNKTYADPPTGEKRMSHRPIIIGMGPAGLFCALELAKAGYCPLILERGESVDDRVKSVEAFWQTGALDKNSNVQFGEGGAGTFSDGKLNTLVKDPYGRHKKVLDTFVSYGAPEEIAYINKPHIGTDRLRLVVKTIRKQIIELGGEVRFQSKVTNLRMDEGKIKAIIINDTQEIPCETVVLAIGHSARDTFEMIHQHKFSMQAKSFAMGVRVEHLQTMIGKAQYGTLFEKLPAADYKMTHSCKNGRGVYSFCMCPGGFVVNASSEPNRLAINGMSNYDRKERNANSAIIVTVTPDDFADTDAMAGVAFQRKWESLAYQEGLGNVPVQRFADFKENKETKQLGDIKPNIKGVYRCSNLRNCLPPYVSESIQEGMEVFDRIIPGFAKGDVLLSGVETRTSSPVRIVRDENSLESNYKGIYPCGEGAGYAGGIVSAAMDGIKVYERIASIYAPMKK